MEEDHERHQLTAEQMGKYVPHLSSARRPLSFSSLLVVLGTRLAI
jgi:hypothetical protein